MYFTVYRDRANEYRWTLYAANHRKIADSGEGYITKDHALHGVGLVMDTNRSSPVYDKTT